MDVTVRIDGLTDVLAKERTMGAKNEGILTDHLVALGATVALDVESRYLPYSTRGGQGVQEKVFTSGLWVVQTIRKATNPLRRRPNFGALMEEKAFEPAARDNEERVELAAELALQEAIDLYWDR